MRWFWLSLFLCYSSHSLAEDAKPGIPRFYLDYAVVQDSLKNGQGVLEQLIELYKAHPQAANFITDFWWEKAKRECSSTFSSVARRYAQKVTASTSESAKKEYEKEAKEEAAQCVYGVYYDHWDEINTMIELRIKKLKTENKNR